MKKRAIAVALAGVMAFSLAACGGGSGGASGGSAETKAAETEAAEDAGEEAEAADEGSGEAISTEGETITIFNTKSEIQDKFEEMAERYSEEKGVNVEVYYSQDTVAAHMATRYSANDPYTISMVDAKDIYSLGPEHAIDLSDQDWVANTDYAIDVDGKVLGFPVCVEARGVLYNADAIKNITGEDFDPASVATLDDFKALIDKLVAGGMEKPTGIMKEDWSLAAHYTPEIAEQKDDVQGFINQLYAGEVDLMSDDKFNSMMDTFDVLKANNYAGDSPVAAEREVSEQKLAEGEIAFMFGGNWDWSMVAEYDYSENMGMMPVPQNMDDGANTKLVGGGSKYLFIDNSENTSDAQRQAAKDFLNWLVFDAEGNAFLTEECALVPAFSNINADALDPFSKSVKAYADAGALIDNYNYFPDDHYSKVGASMQKYLADQVDRAGLAAEIQDYWKSTTPVQQ
jgi:raffinose/stachyose/melibiose transport system substrate-binding protein